MTSFDTPRPAVDPRGTKIRARVMIATPSYNGTNVVEYTQSLQVATLHCFQYGVLLELINTSGFSLVQMARNWLIAEFLSHPEFTHMMWIDDDLGFSPDGIMKLLQSGKDVVGGVYLTKHPRTPMFPYMSAGPEKDHLQKAWRIPGGFLLLTRRAVEAMAAQCEMILIEHDGTEKETPHMFDVALVPDQKDPTKQRVLGEDFVLSHRALEAGFDIFVRTDIAFSHIGRNAWNGKLSKTLADEGAAGFGGQGSVLEGVPAPASPFRNSGEHVDH